MKWRDKTRDLKRNHIILKRNRKGQNQGEGGRDGDKTMNSQESDFVLVLLNLLHQRILERGPQRVTAHCLQHPVKRWP